MRHRIGFTLRFFSRMYLAFKCSGIGSICNSIYSFFWWNKRSRVLRILYGEWDDFGWANTSTVIGDWFLIFVQVAKSAIEIDCLYSDIFCFLCNIFVESISLDLNLYRAFCNDLKKLLKYCSTTCNPLSKTVRSLLFYNELRHVLATADSGCQMVSEVLQLCSVYACLHQVI